MRGYVRSTFEFAGALHPFAVPDGINARALRFAAAEPANVMADDDPHAAECDRTMGMDFENYVIGAAINGRGNYDYTHPDFRQARAKVRARVWELGWRSEEFSSLDEGIAMSAERPYSSSRKVERYGKKYSWVAYHEMVGRLADAGRAPAPFGEPERLMPDIDPGFPDKPPAAPVPLPPWASVESRGHQTWVTSGSVAVPDHLWSPKEIHGVDGGWLLAEGYLAHEQDGRTVFGFFRTLLLAPEDAKRAQQFAAEQEYPGNDFFPSLPKTRGVLATEMPWSSSLAVSLAVGEVTLRGRSRRYRAVGMVETRRV
ncbi:hypothetical protein ACWD04_33595, partial [Streptomyces sp. NPDC002911]